MQRVPKTPRAGERSVGREAGLVDELTVTCGISDSICTKPLLSPLQRFLIPSSGSFDRTLLRGPSPGGGRFTAPGPPGSWAQAAEDARERRDQRALGALQRLLAPLPVQLVERAGDMRAPMQFRQVDTLNLWHL